MKPVQKHNLTSVIGIRAGEYLTMDYQKKTQRAVVVIEVGTDENGIPWILVQDRRGNLTVVRENTLDEFDIKSVAHV